jgi:hypothetical protein
MDAGLLGLTMNGIQSKQIDLIVELHPKRFTLLDLFIISNEFHVIEDTPDEVDDLVLLVLIVIEDGNGIDDIDDLFDRLDLKQRFLDDHLLQLVDLLEEDLVLLALDDYLDYSEELEDALLSVDIRKD